MRNCFFQIGVVSLGLFLAGCGNQVTKSDLEELLAKDNARWANQNGSWADQEDINGQLVKNVKYLRGRETDLSQRVDSLEKEKQTRSPSGFAVNTPEPIASSTGTPAASPEETSTPTADQQPPPKAEPSPSDLPVPSLAAASVAERDQSQESSPAGFQPPPAQGQVSPTSQPPREELSTLQQKWLAKFHECQEKVDQRFNKVEGDVANLGHIQNGHGQRLGNLEEQQRKLLQGQSENSKGIAEIKKSVSSVSAKLTQLVEEQEQAKAVAKARAERKRKASATPTPAPPLTPVPDPQTSATVNPATVPSVATPTPASTSRPAYYRSRCCR